VIRLADPAQTSDNDAMSRPSRLAEADIDAGMATIPAWTRDGDRIRRSVETPSFPAAIAFVTRVGFLAEAADHHPDIDVRWRAVHLVLTTHDAGGLTELDLALAAAIDRVVVDGGAA
jgi:4a-hydroxytetrahydrobiopterin dehydratase